MAIKIIDEPDIYLTAGEHARLQREWQKACAYTVNPPTFEDFVRRSKAPQEVADTLRKLQSVEGKKGDEHG